MDATVGGAAVDQDTCLIYVCRDSDGEILYIGSTVDLKRRIIEHRCKSEWWDEVDDVESFEMPDVETARQRERDAIASVRPTYNVQSVNRDRAGVMRGATGTRKNGVRRLTRQ